MAKYVKLGEKALSFCDPFADDFTINGKLVKKLTPAQESSPAIQRALAGGHLVNATKEEFDASEALLSGKPVETDNEPTDDFEDKTKSELLEYYKETYEVDEDQIAAFDKLDKKGRVAELRKLAKEG